MTSASAYYDQPATCSDGPSAPAEGPLQLSLCVPREARREHPGEGHGQVMRTQGTAAIVCA
eukprot:scaffold1811_cov411-Prasinococcus_capsulatus_cf.AAC.10